MTFQPKEARRQWFNGYQKRRRAEAKKNGICVDCRNPDRPTGKHVLCLTCRVKRCHREQLRTIRLCAK